MPLPSRSHHCHCWPPAWPSVAATVASGCSTVRTVHLLPSGIARPFQAPTSASRNAWSNQRLVLGSSRAGAPDPSGCSSPGDLLLGLPPLAPRWSVLPTRLSPREPNRPSPFRLAPTVRSWWTPVGCRRRPAWRWPLSRPHWRREPAGRLAGRPAWPSPIATAPGSGLLLPRARIERPAPPLPLSGCGSHTWPGRRPVAVRRSFGLLVRRHSGLAARSCARRHRQWTAAPSARCTPRRAVPSPAG